MPQRNEILLTFHCGVCTKQLTDETALFTSCGHFFCVSPESKCTRLRPTGSGRCEQCGKQCDAGNLANRGSRYDSRVQSFVFSDITKDLRAIAEIIEFRDTHLQILGENAAAQQKRMNTLIAECKQQMAETEDLRRENEKLRSELSRQKIVQLPVHNLESPTATRTYGHDASDGVTVVELDPPVRTRVLQISKPRGAPQQGVRINRGNELSTRTQALTQQTYDRSLRNRSINRRRESQAMGTRLREIQGGIRKENGSTTLKRRWADRAETGGAYESSKAGRKRSESRFGYRTGDSRGAVRDSYKPRQRFAGDWQRKVSSVPRPSATPDRLRRRGRRSIPEVNLLGKGY